MKNTALVVTVFVLPLILAAFATGWTLSGLQKERPRAEAPQPLASTAPAEETVPQLVPEEDVPGRDLAGLPRYPDSTRVGYRHEQIEDLARTQAEYATSADSDEIRTFYRDAFRSGDWIVADLGFSPEKWYFFVDKGEREALVEIKTHSEPVVVKIELTRPEASPANDAPASPPVRPTPEPPQTIVETYDGGDDDAEDADDYYEGGDD